MTPTQPSPDKLLVPNTYMRQFFRFLGSHPQLLQGTEETAATLAKLGGFNSFKDYCQFFRNARQLTGDPAIGLRLGRVNQLSNMHGQLSTALYNSLDMRDCLQLFNRFIPLRNQANRSQWIETEDATGLEICYLTKEDDIYPSVVETMVMSLNNAISVASERRIAPFRIELDYPKPSYADQYQQAFEAETIVFSQPAIQVLLRNEDIDSPTAVDSDPEVRILAINRMEQLLKGFAEPLTITEKIQEIFADNPGHLWTLTEIAQHLNMSARTLQRRLKKQQVSYQSLQSEWLKGESQKLLCVPQLSIESVAMLLGYSDVSNFRQACRRWYGCSPQALRKNLLADKDD